MEQWQKNLYVLWFGTFIAAISFSFISPFLPVFLEQLGTGSNLEAWSGAIFSASFLSGCILSPVWGSLADKYGRKVMIIRAGFGMGTINLLVYLVQTPVQLFILRMLNGAVSGFIPSAIALVATNTPEDKVGTSLGILKTGSATGNILGPLVGGVLSHYIGIRHTFVVAGLTIWAATLIVLFGVEEVTKPLGKSAKISVIDDLRIAWVNTNFRTLMLFVTLTNATVAILQPVLTPFIMTITTGDPSLATGVLFSLTGLATVLAAPLWSKKGSSVGFANTFQISMILSGVLNLPQALTTNTISFGLLRFAYGLVYAGAQISIEGLTATTVAPDFRGRAFGISHSFSNLGSVLGPIIGGFVGSTLGIKWVFIINGSLLVCFGFFSRTLQTGLSQVQTVDKADCLKMD